MNISELNHLENVNESNVVKGGLTVNADSFASASGIFPAASSYSDVSITESDSYGYYYYGSDYTSGYGSSSAGASAVAGSASAGSYASGSTGYYYY